MIVPGLVSITFRRLAPEDVIGLVARAGLKAIEWGGDIHVPHGDEARAREVGELTRAAGLTVAAYGSYYRIGHSDQDGLPFAKVLASARALAVPVIRVWAGTKGSADADTAYADWIAREARRIAAEAEDAGIRVALEFHGGTLTDTTESAVRLLESAGHPNLRTLWQPARAWKPEVRSQSLRAIGPWLEHVHVFHWADDGARQPLAEGAAHWVPWLREAGRLRPGCAALIEFVVGDQPASFLDDAAALKEWLAAEEPGS